MNDLINIPQWTEEELIIINSVRLLKDGATQKLTYNVHYIKPSHFYLNKEEKKFINKFLFCSDIFYEREKLDEILCYTRIEHRQNGPTFNFDGINPKYSRFIIEKIEKQQLTKIRSKNKYELIVKYYIIKQSLISYLFQTGKDKAARDLEELFNKVRKNNYKSFDEYIDAKAKQLLEINCDAYLEYLRNS